MQHLVEHVLDEFGVVPEVRQAVVGVKRCGPRRPAGVAIAAGEPPPGRNHAARPPRAPGRADGQPERESVNRAVDGTAPVRATDAVSHRFGRGTAGTPASATAASPQADGRVREQPPRARPRAANAALRGADDGPPEGASPADATAPAHAPAISSPAGAPDVTNPPPTGAGASPQPAGPPTTPAPSAPANGSRRADTSPQPVGPPTAPAPPRPAGGSRRAGGRGDAALGRAPAATGPAPRSVTVNVAESPLSWLRARGLVDARQFEAGERLRADYERAGLGARVTMRWDAAPAARGPRGAAPAADASLARLCAKRRFDEAVAAAGPGLADIMWRVVCAGEGLPLAERALGWPARSGKLVLCLALNRVAAHYHLP